jgi:hypothetical protein
MPDHGWTAEDAEEIESDSSEMLSIAKDAAEYYDLYHDGWEAHWPLLFAIDK